MNKYDKLDLLGVRYDAEMELKMMYELAEEVSNYVKETCTDTNVMSNEFYIKCIDIINKRLGYNSMGGVIHDDVYKVWEIIENEFI